MWISRMLILSCCIFATNGRDVSRWNKQHNEIIEVKSPVTDDECSFALKNSSEVMDNLLTTHHPLMLESTIMNSLPQFVEPSVIKNHIRIKNNEKVRFVCAGKNNHFENIRETRDVIATCGGKGRFIIDNRFYDASQLKCVSTNAAVLKKDPANSRCAGFYNLYEIGYHLSSNNQFIPLIQICRDDSILSTLYAKHVIDKNVNIAKPTMKRPSFHKDAIHNSKDRSCDMNKLYPATQEIKTIAKILGSQRKAEKYINGSDYLLVRGHLAPNADYFTIPGRIATFFYANTVPQYQSINAGRWVRLEKALRHYASEKHVNLEIYTGSLGQLTLKNEREEEQPIWLCYDGIKGKVPVPRFLWKIVYDKVNKKGLAFVASNNPFERFQQNICHTINKDGKSYWFPPVEDQDVKTGIVYVCDATDVSTHLKYDLPINIIKSGMLLSNMNLK